MKKIKGIATQNAEELANSLGLSAGEAVELEVRRQLNDKIVQAVKGAGLTHVQVAKIAGTSRTRLTAILNRNTRGVSTDLMVRILGAMGWRMRVGFSKSHRPA